ncbi:MAG TPA: geranylgeranyl reductase family protein [Anaerolineales bacterium]|jgi:geranylgeranyl reductase family protein
MSAAPRHQVAVVGAGPAGSLAAYQLARQGHDVVLLDKQTFPRDKVCGDAISPRAVHLLAGIGLTSELQHAGHRVTALAATAPGGTSLRVELKPHGQFGAEAYVIRRFDLDDLLRQKALDAGAAFAAGAHVDQLNLQPSGYRVSYSQHGERRRLLAEAVVLAVGASLPLVQSAGMTPQPVQYGFAARAYYRQLPDLQQELHFRFDGIPLPGYGWIFPLGEHEANVGAGYFERSAATPASPAAYLAQFLSHPPIARQFAHAERVGPVKGYPLRTDFHRSRSVGERLLLVGEAAGLVNPFTGEGIDYALESGQLAGRWLGQCLNEGDVSQAALAGYDRQLRRRFQATFVYTHLLRSLYMTPLLLDPLLRASRRWTDLADRLVRIFLAYEHPLRAVTPIVALRVLRSLRPVPPAAAV